MIEITWLGHGTYQMRLATGEVILVDPWIEGNPAYPSNFAIDRVDVMLISHGHFDHIHDALPLARKFSPQIVAIYETAFWLEKKGAKNVIGINKGGTVQVGPIAATMTHAIHSCGILDDDKIIYGGEAAGYVVRLPDRRSVYCAGDTNVFTDMQLIERLYHPELAFLPIGDFYTMSPREAALACRMLNVRKVIPLHFGTFPALTGRPEQLAELIRDLPSTEVWALPAGRTGAVVGDAPGQGSILAAGGETRLDKSTPGGLVPALIIIALVLLLRLPFLHQAIQGDDLYYLIGAQHGQIDPLHPTHARFLFLGEMVDMRGFSHPPLNAWILTGLLAAVGDVREVPFHLAYIPFSILAALAMWSLARRFCEKPFLATLLFLAVPAFVVNGGSLESDLPFLAFWMTAVALFVKALDLDAAGKASRAALYGSAIAGALAGLAAYQAVFLVPVLGFYAWQKRPRWYEAWAVTLAAPLAIGAWQVFELVTSGPIPAAVLAGYLGTRGFQSLAQKSRSAAALIVHSGWIISPVLVLAGFIRGSRWRWILAALASALGAWFDPNPLFWASLGCGVLVLASCAGRDFLGVWVLVFFAGALAVFFAGSARYLLPVAAPVAILAARRCGTLTLAVGFALQMVLSLGLAVVNFQHWDAYRQFAASMSKETAAHRVWINGDWGLRFYLESEGALALPLGQVLQSGEMLVSSALANPLPVNAPLAPFSQIEIRPSIPLRLVSLDGRSAYSSASSRGLLPFEISTGPIDRVSASAVIERQPQLTYLDPHDPAAASQIISGLFPDGWMTEQATVVLRRPDAVLKRPDGAADLRAVIYIPESAPARRVTMLLDGQQVAQATYAAPGSYSLDVRIPPEQPHRPGAGPGRSTVTLAVDKTFSVPGDQRKLGAIVTGIGFR